MNQIISDSDRIHIIHTQAVLKSAAYLLPFFVLGLLIGLWFVFVNPQIAYVLMLCMPVSLYGMYLVWRCVLDVHLWAAVLSSGSLSDLDECLSVFFKRSLNGASLEVRLAGNRGLFRKLMGCLVVQICLVIGVIVRASLLVI